MPFLISSNQFKKNLKHDLYIKQKEITALPKSYQAEILDEFPTL